MRNLLTIVSALLATTVAVGSAHAVTHAEKQAARGLERSLRKAGAPASVVGKVDRVLDAMKGRKADRFSIARPGALSVTTNVGGEAVMRGVEQFKFSGEILSVDGPRFRNLYPVGKPVQLSRGVVIPSGSWLVSSIRRGDDAPKTYFVSPGSSKAIPVPESKVRRITLGIKKDNLLRFASAK